MLMIYEVLVFTTDAAQWASPREVSKGQWRVLDKAIAGLWITVILSTSVGYHTHFAFQHSWRGRWRSPLDVLLCCSSCFYLRVSHCAPARGILLHHNALCLPWKSGIYSLLCRVYCLLITMLVKVLCRSSAAEKFGTASLWRGVLIAASQQLVVCDVCEKSLFSSSGYIHTNHAG